MNNHNQDYIEPIGVTASGVVVYGLTLSEWVAILTMVYLVIHIALLLPRFIKEFDDFIGFIKRKRGEKKDDSKG